MNIKEIEKILSLNGPRLAYQALDGMNQKQITFNDIKTNLYMLTFNFPEQVIHTIKTMEKAKEWLEKPNLILLDNFQNIRL